MLICLLTQVVLIILKNILWKCSNIIHVLHFTIPSLHVSFDLSSPHANEDVAVPKDEEQDVLLGDVVEVGILFIGKEKVGLPEALEHFGVHGQ